MLAHREFGTIHSLAARSTLTVVAVAAICAFLLSAGHVNSRFLEMLYSLHSICAHACRLHR